MTRAIFFCGGSLILAVNTWPTRDEVQNWALLLFGLAGLAIPVIKKFGENLIALRKTARDSLRKDCLEDLKRERQTTRDLRANLRATENDRDEWKRRFDGGSRDHPKVG